MKIIIIGAGGVGGYFGGKLAKAGNDVTFIARGEHMNKMKTNGLLVKSILGDFLVYPVKVTDRISEAGVADLVILAVKAWQVIAIMPEIKSLINQNTIILPLQNGVSTFGELRHFVSDKNIMGGFCRTYSKLESAGVIIHFGITPTIIFGETDHSKTERLTILKDLFDNSGITSIISEDIQSDLWKKFILICLSGFLAVTSSTYGELREIKETRQMMIDILAEVYKLSIQAGAIIDPDFIGQTISYIDTLPYETTASLSRDVLEGKPSEIEYQNGTVVRLAEKYGIETPLNRFIYRCILPMEIKARANQRG